jgi:hypothetical protein
MNIGLPELLILLVVAVPFVIVGLLVWIGLSIRAKGRDA